jgi:GT2 family glycosyltransferase
LGPEGVFLHCDGVVGIATQGIFVKGWFHAREGAVVGVACHGGFRSVFIDQDWLRYSRRDVSTHLASLGVAVTGHDHGIGCFVPIENGSSPYFLSVTTAAGQIHRVRVPPVAALPALEAIRAVLTSFSSSHRSLLGLLDTQVGPAVQKVWAERRKVVRPVTSERFGPAVRDPAVSVIVPLFGRYDFAEYQLAQFADDADFQGLELLYFVDDPGIYDEFRAQCDGLYQLYRVPFTLAFAGANLGFAGANNAAARIAGGKHLLLLNSDVLPKYPGWVSELLALYGTLKKPGCLGVKLLYEDGSVQHAGMTFRRHAPWGNLWINDHPHKGQSAEGLSGLHQVEAVTAACLLLKAELYRDLGGLSEDYVIGDFEDSDLCLRAASLGLTNWVSLDTELYHLERQSQARIGDAEWRTNLTLFNCWQHSRRWASHLENRPA